MGQFLTLRSRSNFGAAVFAALSFAIMLIAGSALAAPSGTLLDERVKRDQSRSIADEARYTSEVCDTTITASIHWESFESRDGNLNRAYDKECDTALSAIERICREGKWEEVAQQIKRVNCGAGTKRRVVLNNGTLLFAITTRPRNDHQYVYDYLKKKL